MSNLISFYSVAHSQGKRTLSLSFASLLAKDDNKVLYFELDYKKPSVAISTRITDQTCNTNEFFQNIAIKNSFDVEPYILKKEKLLRVEDRNLRKIYSDLPNNLDYLIYPLNFQEGSFPNLLSGSKDAEQEAQDFIAKLMYSLKTTRYDFVILNLPLELNSIFGYEVIINSDQIVNVVTPSAARLAENKKIEEFLFLNNLNLPEKWFKVLNMTSREVNEVEYIQLVDDEPVLIPFDSQRHLDEFALRLDSESIQERLEELALKMNIQITQSTPKRKLFSRR